MARGSLRRRTLTFTQLLRSFHYSFSGMSEQAGHVFQLDEHKDRIPERTIPRCHLHGATRVPERQAASVQA